MERPIVVVGSINMDLVLRVPKLPRAGETLSGSTFAKHPGGKGANQAVGVGRLQYPVQMIGMVGHDEFGRELLKAMASSDVDITHVGMCDDVTGLAAITVDDEGENSIIVIAGANNAVTPAFLQSKAACIQGAGMVMTQLEIPMESVRVLARLCAESSVPLILDPAPAQPLHDDLIRSATWITPNESEAQLLTKGALSSEAQMAALRTAGAQGVILKRGAAGVAYSDASDVLHFVSAPKVTVRDTTAAGDGFNAAFAVGVMRGYSTAKSIRFAVTAAALSVTRDGAQSSLATGRDVEAALVNGSGN